MTYLKPKFSMEFSLGNLAILISTILAIVAGYYSLIDRVNVNITGITNIREFAIDDARTSSEFRSMVSDRVRSIELNAIRQEERTNNVLSSLTRIERQLQRIDNRFDRE